MRCATPAALLIAFKTPKMVVLLSPWVKAQDARGCATIAPPIWVPTITILLETHPCALTKQTAAWVVQCPDKATHVVRQATEPNG